MADYDDFDGYSENDEYDNEIDPEDIGESVPPWRAIIDFPPYFIDRTIFWTGVDGTMQQYDIIPPIDPSENDEIPPPPDRPPPPPSANYEQDNLLPREVVPPREPAISSSSITIPLSNLEFGAPRRPRCTDLREWLFHNAQANLVPIDLSGLAAITVVSFELGLYVRQQSISFNFTFVKDQVRLEPGFVTRLDRIPRRLDFSEPLPEGEMARYDFMFRSAQQACRELATLLPEWLESLCQLRDVYDELSRETKEMLKLDITLAELHGYSQERLSDVSSRLMAWFTSSPIGCLDIYIDKILPWIARLPSRTRSITSEVERITNTPSSDFTTSGDYLQDLARKMIGLTIVVKSGWYGINDVKARVKHFREHTRAETAPTEETDSLPDLVEAVSETML
ncbi:hypothetical protein H2200_005701 [Cladophialophora chaetospira]|uniref:Uncharacterized protein n=1 Tax=Cladophialophora chaetospira TaxID=386627 RepID=A0AA39CIE9_9EURO|nr:hypothetical protein H2200_005701 [Cladophialophora chaetospira]